ncbi:hypothetical protein QR680_010363 [Steinernema hermaphroditum]|uniref:Acyltransferase 3 domain-containing protein n=1 Tax=Steinernema hermaphroditum TaxID=289476 RepID=A0AA39IPX8_9BILA|nr:hypothetical protein QR680_010363 [Steinernema hermaphroditum]
MSAPKRDDLQGIRGLAIILVLLFHFYPKAFKNGFAGVDIFFVLSGYLMQMIYAERTSGFHSILTFYKRRFIRLLPMYYLTVLFTLMVGKCLLLETDYNFLKSDSKWAMFLVSNIKGLIEKRGYFDMVSEFSLLLHTWSLAVEMQFYLLAPLFFYLVQRVDSPSTKLLICSAIALPSMLLHVFSTGSMSFDFLFSRIWQFQLGAASAIATVKKAKKGNELHFFLYLLLVIICLPLSFETSLTEKCVRIFVTLLSTVLFAVGSAVNNSNFRPNLLATHRLLTYTGDISYVVYLVHWPAILFYKYVHDVQDFAVYEVFGLLVLIFVVSIAIHHLIEKPLLTEHVLSAFLSALCLALAFYLAFAASEETSVETNTGSYDEKGFYWQNETRIDPKWTQDELIKNAIKKDLDWNAHGLQFRMPEGCNPNTSSPAFDCTLKKSGSVKAIVAGNSFAFRAMAPVYETLKEKYSHMYMIMMSSCEMFGTDMATYPIAKKGSCHYLARWIHEATESMQPDILFLVHRYLGAFQAPIQNISSDQLVINAIAHLESLSKSATAIVISGPLHRFNGSVAAAMARQLQFKKNITGVDYPITDYEKEHKYSMERLNYIVSKCPKCVLFEMQRPFCGADGQCSPFDKNTFLPLISDDEHVSYRGNKVLYTSLKKTVDEILVKHKL